MVQHKDALQDAINAVGSTTGLVAAQTGKSAATYAANMQAGQQVVDAAKTAEAVVSAESGGNPADPSSNASLLMNMSAGAVAVAVVSAVCPTMAVGATMVGAAHSACNVISHLKSKQSEYSPSLEDSDETELAQTSSAPSRNIELQETVNTPAFAMNDPRYDCFAESLNQSVEGRGTGQVLRELREGATLKAAEGQIAFSKAQLEDMDAMGLNPSGLEDNYSPPPAYNFG